MIWRKGVGGGKRSLKIRIKLWSMRNRKESGAPRKWQEKRKIVGEIKNVNRVQSP